MKRLAPLALCVVLAGCGGSGEAQPGPQETDVAAVAQAFANALGRRDWKGVCATRTRAEQAALARKSGTCERAFALAFKGKPTAVMQHVTARNVRIRGNLAGVDLQSSNGLGSLGRFAAVRENGHWRMENLPASQIP